MHKDVIYAFSRRQDGNMSLAYGDTKGSLSARELFLSKLGIDYRDIVCAKQIHASGIACVQDTDRGRGALSQDAAIESSDALVTDQKNIPLSIFTADCLSVFLYAPKHKVIGLVHAGWRGTKDSICTKVVHLIRERFRVEPVDLYAVFGPLIRQCCYEVGNDCAGSFPGKFLVGRNKRHYLDLSGANKGQLLDSGMAENHIFDPGICTSCSNNEFFSFRKEKNASGRMISVVMMK